MIARTPMPPYYAVIFSTLRSENVEGYHEMAEKMEALAKEQPGFLGMETAHEKIGITISYWRNREAIQQWKEHAEHVIAQEMGRKQWYEHYKVRIAKVDRDYDFEK